MATPYPDFSQTLNQSYPDFSESKGQASSILNEIEQQSMQKEAVRTPQPQEQFSNPTAWPGFQNLPAEEQKNRIALSAFDPANQTSTGGSVPPGSYENPITRMGASVIPSLAIPEVRMGENILARFVLDPALNALNRTASGTVSNVAYNSPDIKNIQDLKHAASSGFGENALLEGGAFPARMAGGFAELFNPKKLTDNAVTQIQNETSASKAVMNNMYKPVNDAYNNSLVTVTPKQYLQSAGINRTNLYADAKLLHDDFLNNPIFDNLHKLQSQIGRDASKISGQPTRVNRLQLFNQYQDNLQDKIQHHLSQDPKALSQYNAASNYAKNVYFPYLSNNALRDISTGNKDVSSMDLINAIQKSKNNIPEGHALINHLSTVKNAVNLGKAAQYAMPAMIGAIGGEIAHPGLGGVIGGGIAGGTLSGLASKLGAPTLSSFIQNPYIQNKLGFINPLYYGGGRAAINYYNQNK